uniref:Uncharacterized protein n=1 Tax=Arundo donax TaxID=35708 RepID=A0A0A9TFC6_ARUDO
MRNPQLKQRADNTKEHTQAVFYINRTEQILVNNAERPVASQCHLQHFLANDLKNLAPHQRCQKTILIDTIYSSQHLQFRRT